jgi:hypothetical protein
MIGERVSNRESYRDDQRRAPVVNNRLVVGLGCRPGRSRRTAVATWLPPGTDPTLAGTRPARDKAMLTCRMLRSYHLLQKMKARSLELTSDPTEVGT